MRRRAGISLALCLAGLAGVAGIARADTWSRTYGTPGLDAGMSIAPAGDGGFAVAGFKESGDRSAGWVLRIDEFGDVLWEKFYAAGDDSWLQDISPTRDGGFVAVGSTLNDAWVLKLDASGEIQRSRLFRDGTDAYPSNYFRSVVQTADGGYIIAGHTSGFRAGTKSDLWVLKLDATGEVLWERTYGGDDYDWAHAVTPTSDGGFAVVGHADSHGTSLDEAVLLKLDRLGRVEWARGYGTDSYEEARAVAQTPDGGYLMAGITRSQATAQDAWVLKLSPWGDIQRQLLFAGPREDSIESLVLVPDGFVVAGTTSSFGRDWLDAALVRFDDQGNVRWLKTYGGPTWEVATSVCRTRDGGFALAGVTTDSYGGPDVWVMKVDANGGIGPSCPLEAGAVVQGQPWSATAASLRVRAADSTALVRDEGGSLDSEAEIREQCRSWTRPDDPVQPVSPTLVRPWEVAIPSVD